MPDGPAAWIWPVSSAVGLCLAAGERKGGGAADGAEHEQTDQPEGAWSHDRASLPEVECEQTPAVGSARRQAAGVGGVGAGGGAAGGS